MRTGASASSALAVAPLAVRAALHTDARSETRASMTRENVSSYVVAYIVSTLLVAAGRLSFTSNPSSWSLAPVKMLTSQQYHQYQYHQLLTYYYCYLYSTCPECCKYWYLPRFTTGLTTSEMLPSWDSVATISRNRLSQNTLNNSPMLDKENLSLFSQLVDYYKRVSKITVRQKSLSKPKTTLKSSKVTSSPLKNLKAKTNSTMNVVDIINNVITNGRRSNDANILSDLAFKSPGIQPPVLVPKATNHILDAINHMVNTTEHIQSAINDIQRKTEHVQHTTHHMQNTINHIHNTTDHMHHTINKNLNKDDRIDIKHSSNGIIDINDEAHGDFIFDIFRAKLDQVERKFLLSVFTKLTAISPEDRRENGISFLQSGFFLYQLLLSLSITMDSNVTREIEDFLDINMTDAEKIEILERTVLWLPKSSDVLKFRWSSRLVMQVQGGDKVGRRAALTPPLQVNWLHGNETPADLTRTLNDMVLSDSGGSMHDTFEEEEVSGGVCAAALGTACVRASWRAAPTLLNDTLPFRDAPAAPNRTSRFFRLNDIMGYSYLNEWDAEAIEISYATPGLTLLIVVPKEASLRPLVQRVARTSLQDVLGVMRPLRLAVTLPLYTLRMTLLLPNKLQDMGMPSLVTNDTDCRPIKLSHAVQRLMFWAEAGRNAFKDDGIEWDPEPELEIVVDRPYLFFVRWENITIMNGAFTL